MEDLSGALGFAEKRTSSRPQYSVFADAVSQAITDNLVGSGEAAQQQLTTPCNRTELAPPPEPSTAPIPSNLSAPPWGSPAASIPWVVPTMAIIAAVLILTFVSAVFRR